MRIVSGFLRGKKLDFLKTNTTRPLRDFVKESTFNVIDHSNLIDISLKNAIILDLYSGVGSFGIECISRGAKKTTFVENNTSALAVLEKNIGLLKIEKKTSIQKTKIISFLKQSKINDEYEIIFFDPPFSEDYFLEELKIIKNSNIYKTNHLVVIHRDKKSKDDFSGIVNIFMTKKYGRSKILFGNFKLNTV